jgi:hypothetical protein
MITPTVRVTTVDALYNTARSRSSVDPGVPRVCVQTMSHAIRAALARRCHWNRYPHPNRLNGPFSRRPRFGTALGRWQTSAAEVVGRKIQLTNE